MTKREFTNKITQLIREMIDAGEEPIIDYAMRSPEEQNRLWKAGKSACDGYVIKSRHNQGLAMDIYLVKDNKAQYEWDRDKAIKWHNRFMEITGAESWIEWDPPHFSSDGR
jgi:hypothetical protein